MSKSAFAFQEFIRICEEENEEVLDILKFSKDDLITYNKLLDNFVLNNSSKTTAEEKGKSLENLVKFIFEKSAIFEVKTNVRTSTNEIDLLIKLNEKGIQFRNHGFLNLTDWLICECKNYNKTVGVTWVGKLYSLLTNTNKKIGIIFSYYGLAGKGWNSSSGLTKKIHLSTKGEVKIISFNKDDFIQLSKGSSFAKLLENKLDSLENDTSFSKDISEHPLESHIDFNQ